MKKRIIWCALVTFMLSMGVLSADAEAAPKTMADGTVFDAEFYAATYPDVKAAFGDNAELLYQHYIMFGMAEGRQGIDPNNAVTTAPEVQETVSAPQMGGTALVPVIIEAGDEEYIRRGDSAYFRSDLDYLVPVEPGSLFDPANGFVRADCSAEPLYCAMRDYMVAQILAAPSGKTTGTYPIVFTYYNLQEFQYDARIVDNLVVDLYKSGLCRSVYIFNNPAGETITIGYPSEMVYKYFIYK